MTEFDRRNSAPPSAADPGNVRRPRPRPRLVLSVRDTVVLTLTTTTGVAAGVLAHLAGQDAATAVMMGAGAAGAAVALYDKVVGE
jgi:hypothetical protein